MKFKINNRQWNIEEVESNFLLKKYKEYDEQALYCFGMTKYEIQTIFINKDMDKEVKKQTLYHELMHCYIWNYSNIHNEYTEEELCDLSANSHDIIHKIVEDYFNLKSKGE
jgi:Zn-dependent peptidase ImmA (M78 family)